MCLISNSFKVEAIFLGIHRNKKTSEWNSGSMLSAHLMNYKDAMGLSPKLSYFLQASYTQERRRWSASAYPP
jgi:hypothetical protein